MVSENKPKHWISEALVHMLITELKDEAAAAEVILGWGDSFIELDERIGNVITKAQELKSQIQRNLCALLFEAIIF